MSRTWLVLKIFVLSEISQAHNEDTFYNILPTGNT